MKEGDSFVAEITIPFTYEKKDGKTVVTSLGEATAKNIAGWVHVKRAVTIDQDQTIYAKEGAQVAIYVICEASVGSGYQTYDDSIYFDLSMI